jgi:hypothetical protein
LLNVQESLHRTPYEELPSINEDGSIIALKTSMSFNPIMNNDFLLGQFMSIDMIKHENNPDGLLEKMARAYPEGCDIGVFQSFGYVMSKYLIDRPHASWGDLQSFLKETIKNMSFWVADDGSEGYIILVVSPVHQVSGDIETFPSEDDERIYVYDKLGWRHTLMIHWTNDEIISMNTAINSNGHPYISYHMGASYYSQSDSLLESKPYFIGGEYLNLLTMLKPVKLDIINRSNFEPRFNDFPRNLPDMLDNLDMKRDKEIKT